MDKIPSIVWKRLAFGDIVQIPPVFLASFSLEENDTNYSMAVIALVGYYTKWYFLAAVALVSVALIYIFVINPKYMNRHLVKRKK